MKKYTIEEIKNNQWIEGNQTDLDKLLKIVGAKPMHNIYKGLFHFYLTGNTFGGWNMINGMSQRGKEIIKFSDIDFNENILSLIEIY